MTEQTMIERAARAICVANGRDPDQAIKGIGTGILGVGEPTPLWKHAEAMARAAIAAMREPTPVAANQILEGMHEQSFEASNASWRAAIDAILAEKTE